MCWRLQLHDVLAISNYLRAEILEITDETVTCFQALAAARPGVTLAEMLALAQHHDLAADHLYTLMVTDKLYVDLAEAPLAHPAPVRLFCSQAQAELFPVARHISAGMSQRPLGSGLAPGAQVEWNGQLWEIIHLGDTNIWLKSAEGQVTSLDEKEFGDLLSQGKIAPREQFSHTDAVKPEAQATELLARSGPAALAVANRRYQLLTEYQRTSRIIDQSVSQRTILRWQASFRAAEVQYACGFVGLLPHSNSQGNHVRRFPPEALALMEDYITREYEQPAQPPRFAVWSKLLRECKERGLVPPSYQTFCLAVKNRLRHQQITRRQGARAAYQSTEVYLELELTTPRHGDRPFEIAHLDHTELDIELVSSTSRRNLGRPWATFMTDAYSRRVLAAVLCFDPPSYRSCMLAMRECVARFSRLPQTIVMDGGREFGSVYFETLLARYEITKKTRPASQPRFGSLVERLFGTSNTRFVHNLAGNTQSMKDDLCHMTDAVNPQRLATWTLAELTTRLAEFAYEVYDQIDHPALGQSPRQAFTQGMLPQRRARTPPYG